MDVQGTVWLNGVPVPARTGTVFPGDSVQTQERAIANLHASGSNVMVLADTVVWFHLGEVLLDSGGVAVATMNEMSVQAGGVRVTPVTTGTWTQFQVISQDGTVQVLAQKGDVRVSDSKGTTTVSQGQQVTREDEEKKKRKKREGAMPPEQTGLLSSKKAILIGLGVGGGATAWVLTRPDDPLSPYKPK